MCRGGLGATNKSPGECGCNKGEQTYKGVKLGFFLMIGTIMKSLWYDTH